MIELTILYTCIIFIIVFVTLMLIAESGQPPKEYIKELFKIDVTNTTATLLFGFMTLMWLPVLLWFIYKGLKFVVKEVSTDVKKLIKENNDG